MKKSWKSISAAAICALPAMVSAAVPVEQIEAEQVITGSDPNYNFQQYAPVEFGGSATLAGTGVFTGVTFHAVDPTNDTSTLDTTIFHPQAVANIIYGSGSIGSNYVTNAYNAGAIDFLLNTVNAYNTSSSNLFATGVNALPGHFATGVKVVNNSWVGNYASIFNSSGASAYNLPTLRRYDFMVNRDDVTSVVAAYQYGSTNPLLSASFNSITVSGSNFGTESGSPAKQHADLYLGGEVSFSTATVSGYAAGLYGNAQTALQSDAQHGYIIKSLLMAGTDKSAYPYPGGGALGAIDATYGVGQPNYDTSLSILQSGEKSLLTVSSNAVTGTPATVQKGWGISNISAGAQNVLLFNSSNAITGLSASLNWNVTSVTSGTNINTTTGALIFPNLALEVRAVTFNTSTGKWILAANQSTPALYSNVSGDNTQYIYSTTGLAAGTYALVVTNLSGTYSANVGLSYTLAGSFATRWNSSTGGSWGTNSSWSNGIANGQAALVTLPAVPAPITLTIDGDRTVGQLTFNSSNGYTLSQGVTPAGVPGVLTIDDTGDSSGVATPLISVLAGSHTINTPLNLSAGLYTNVSSGTTLTINGIISSTNGGLVKNGPGTLTLNAAEAYGNTFLNNGSIILGTSGTLSNGFAQVSSGTTFTFAAQNSGGIFHRNLGVALNVNSGGLVTIAPAALLANRQLLTTVNGLSIAGTTDSWIGKLNLNNNDLVVPLGDLAKLTNQIKQGFNNGTWTGTGGIIDTTAANNTTHLTTLGIILNTTDGTTALYGTGQALGTFDNSSPGANDVLIKYTYFGDANLDGKIDGSDYTRIDNGRLMSLTGWFNGDFNYDGVIDGSDYTLIDNAFNTQTAQMASQFAGLAVNSAQQIAGLSSVPEPACAGAISLTTFACLARRRRRRTNQINLD